MGVLRSACAAFLTFSAIPMPKINYREKDMKYMFIFFPLIGAVIGGLCFLWIWLAGILKIPAAPMVLIFAAIPILVTGGIHVDGFMDTMDAVSSYKSREERIAIMKDPHIGGFAVIRLVVYLLLLLAALFCLDDGGLKSCCFIFVLSRAGSGLAVCFFPSAKSGGMLADEKRTGANPAVVVCLFAWIIGAVLLMLFYNAIYGAVTAALFFISYGLYYFRSKKDYGGITGDLAGAYILMSQLLMTAGIAVTEILLKMGV